MAETVTDGTPYNENPSNSGNVNDDSEPIDDTDVLYYDMSGEKFLVIFNHYKYQDTRYFNYKKPSPRNGTGEDVKKLKQVFGDLGYKVITHVDLERGEIFDAVHEFSKLDHKATSCVCFAFLTHGDKSGDLYAADSPYQFRDLTAILQNGNRGLVGKPKLFFVQACRGKNADDGQRLEIDGCEASFMIPTHADLLVLYSTVEDYVSYRDNEGSFMIQELCKVIEGYHESWDILHIITLLHRRVAYNRTTFAPSNLSFHDKKQMPETRYSLTKLFKFYYKTPSPRNGTGEDVKKLKQVFGDLGYKVITHVDLERGEIFDAVHEFSKLDHKATSCVCFAFLTHGDKSGDLYAADSPYQFRDLTAILQNGNRGLVGKPKLFFVQACRGKNADDGQRLEIDGCEASFMIPTHADLLVLYSTVEDYVSYRDNEGSFMIQELCKVIEGYHESWDFLHIITLLHRRVAYNRTTFCTFEPLFPRQETNA